MSNPANVLMVKVYLVETEFAVEAYLEQHQRVAIRSEKARRSFGWYRQLGDSDDSRPTLIRSVATRTF